MKKKIFLLSLALATMLAFGAAPQFVAAQNASNNSTASNAAASQGPCKPDEKLGACIVNIYRWALGAAVLLALLMVIFAGYKYITSQGNAQAVASAKEMFTGAIIGLIILFAAVVILRTINPDLVRFSDNLPPANNGPAPSP